MGWNGSTAKNKPQCEDVHKDHPRQIRWGRWAMIGGILAVLAVIAYLFFPNSATKDVATTSPHRHTTKTISSPKLNVDSPNNTNYKSAQPQPSNGIALATNKHMSVAAGAKPKTFRIVKPNNRGKKLFHNISDVYISRLVNSTPGHAIIGTMNYDRFAEQFKKSLSTPITIDEDDTPEEVAAKQNVMETRKELKRMLDDGEDIAQVMRETEAELRRLYNYRHNLSQELASTFRERKFNADDMQDYVTAANKILSDNGMEPLKHPEFWIRQMHIQKSAESSER